MKNKNFLLNIFCSALVAGLLSSCGTSEPTRVSDVITEAPSFVPTFTPIAQSTETPPPSAHLFNATVENKDGISFEISNAYIARGTSTGKQWIMDDYYGKDRFEYIYFYTNLTNLKIPLNTIRSIQTTDVERFEFENFKIVLEDGMEMEGKIERRVENHHLIMKLGGTTSVNGYAAEYEQEFRNIISVTFTKDNQGGVLADITEKGGEVIHVSAPWSRLRIPDNNWGIEPLSSIKFETGQYTLDIPLGDIAKIEEVDVGIYGDRVFATLILLSGDKMSGKFSDYLVIIGGENGDFYAEFNDISSIIFH